MQAFIAVAIVVAAVAYLLWRWMPAGLRARLGGSSAELVRAGGCNSCSSCGGCGPREQEPREKTVERTDGAQPLRFVRMRPPAQEPAFESSRASPWRDLARWQASLPSVNSSHGEGRHS